MDDLEVDHELSVFVLEGFVTVGRRNDDLPHTTVDERLDVLLGEALVKVLGTGLPDALAAAALLRTEDAVADRRLVQKAGGGLGDLLHPRVIAHVAAAEEQNLGLLTERSDGALRRPIRPGRARLAQRIAFGGQTRTRRLHDAGGCGDDVIVGCQPTDGDPERDLIDAAGAPFGAVAAGGAAPDVFALDLGQAKGGLADDLPNAEASDFVPRAHDVAFSALKAETIRVSARRLDLVEHFYEGSDRFHA